MEVVLLLDSIQKVEEFINICEQIPYEVDMKYKRYIVDAKSILGLMSLNLKHPVKCIIHTNNSDAIELINSKLEKFKVM